MLVARTPGALEEIDDRVRAAGGQATLVPMDLRDGKAIDQLGGAIAQRFGRLDVLVGNAGEFGTLSPVGHIKPATFEQTLQLNLVANYRLIRSLDALLHASDAGRAIFVTASQAREHRPFWGACAASKAALEALVLTYAAETLRSNLRVNLIDPGPLRTRLRARAYPGESPDKVPLPEEVTEPFFALAERACTRHGEIVHAQPASSASP